MIVYFGMSASKYLYDWAGFSGHCGYTQGCIDHANQVISINGGHTIAT